MNSNRSADDILNAEAGPLRFSLTEIEMSEPTPRTRLTDFASCAGCAGKLPAGEISKVLSYLPKQRDANLLVGTETHDDAGVYRLTNEIALVQTLDFFPPLVDDPFIFGQIAATNALSDVYAMGGTPLTAMNIVGYPDDLISMDWLGRILAGAADRCLAAGCAIVGGHTLREPDIKFGLSVTGTVHPDRIVTNATAKPGDRIILTKPLGTGFIATAAKKNACPPELLTAACRSMTHLNFGARDAMIECGASAATDVTGFGLAGHAFEMAEGSGTTIVFDLAALPLFPGIDAIDIPKFTTRASRTNQAYTADHIRNAGAVDAYRRQFLFDPQTSGGLLIAIPAARADELVRALQQRGTLAAAIVAEVVERRDHALWVR